MAKTFKKLQFMHAFLTKNNMRNEDSSGIEEQIASSALGSINTDKIVKQITECGGPIWSTAGNWKQ